MLCIHSVRCNLRSCNKFNVMFVKFLDDLLWITLYSADESIFLPKMAYFARELELAGNEPFHTESYIFSYMKISVSLKHHQRKRVINNIMNRSDSFNPQTKRTRPLTLPPCLKLHVTAACTYNLPLPVCMKLVKI